MSGGAADGDEPTERIVARFPWQDLPEQLEAFAERFPDAVADARGAAFAPRDGGALLRLPLLCARARPGEAAIDYAARVPPRLGRQCVLLLQAGAAALGWWEDDELVRHVAMKRYVVRGKGRAQPTHLKTRGRSRYGSRLRLQNWRRLLGDVNRRLRTWWEEYGPADLVLLSVPVRTLPELLAHDPPPPFTRGDPVLRRIPAHVHVPDHRELLRIRRLAARGRLELPSSPV